MAKPFDGSAAHYSARHEVLAIVVVESRQAAVALAVEKDEAVFPRPVKNVPTAQSGFAVDGEDLAAHGSFDR